eukprot:scaffold83168_cov60-Phaeocystis_antarctica.AAC.3
MDHRRAHLPQESLPRQLDLRPVLIKICASRHLSGNKEIGLGRREQNVILKCDTYQKKRRRSSHSARKKTTSVAWTVDL